MGHVLSLFSKLFGEIMQSYLSIFGLMPPPTEAGEGLVSGKIPWGRMLSEVTRFLQENRSPQREGVDESRKGLFLLIYVTGKDAHLHLEFRVQRREAAVWAHRPVVFQHVPALETVRVSLTWDTIATSSV